MKKIEERMLKAIDTLNIGESWRESNTTVFKRPSGTFIRLYNTYIAAHAHNKWYYSDGGYKTATTRSRLRALGADYSTNEKKNKVELVSERYIIELMLMPKNK